MRDLVADLTIADVDGWRTTSRGFATVLSLPCFEHRGTWPLLEALAKAGVPRAVSSRAQLDALWAVRPEGSTLVSDAAQTTFFKIDEEGTEAAAVTSSGVVVTSAPPPPIEFRVDAPFVFVIRDEGGALAVERMSISQDTGQ